MGDDGDERGAVARLVPSCSARRCAVPAVRFARGACFVPRASTWKNRYSVAPKATRRRPGSLGASGDDGGVGEGDVVEAGDSQRLALMCSSAKPRVEAVVGVVAVAEGAACDAGVVGVLVGVGGGSGVEGEHAVEVAGASKPSSERNIVSNAEML